MSQNETALLQRLQRVEAENQKLKARLALSPAVNEPGLCASSGDFQLCATRGPRYDRHGATPRAESIIVPTRHRQPDRRGDSSQPLKRAKTVHGTKAIPTQAPSASSNKMARSKSSRQDDHAGSHMHMGHQTLPDQSILPSPAGQAIANPMLTLFISQDMIGQPASAFVYGDSMVNYRASQATVTPLIEHGREYEPDEFLSLLSNPFGMEPDTIPPANFTGPMSISAMDSMSAFQDHQYLQSGLPSTCGSLTSGPTLDTSMSRQNSQAFHDNMSIAGNLDMMRMHSQQSQSGHTRHGSIGENQLFSPDTMYPKAQHEFMHMDANLTDTNFSSPAPPGHYHPMIKSQSQSSMISTSSTDWPRVKNEAPFVSTDMQRTESNQSNKSLKLRAKEALQRQNAHAATIRNIQPKPLLSSTKSDPNNPQSSSPSTTAPNKPKESAKAISKTPYQRPKHPKVYCQQCPQDTEGFRGEHELRRHTEAKHKSAVKKFVCVEPDPTQLPPGGLGDVKVFKRLEDCKQCVAGKQYGAYYNAAAHLRRTHFKMKVGRKAGGNGKNNGKDGKSQPSRSGGGGGGGGSGEDKLGGKGGGDWPPMNVLKLWMRAVTVSANDPTAFADDGMDAQERAELEDMFAHDPQLAEHQTAVQVQGIDQGSAFLYDNSVVSGAGGGFAAVGTEFGDGSFQGLQEELGGLGGGVDPAVFLAAQSAGFGFAMSIGGQGFMAQQAVAGGCANGEGEGGQYTSPVSSTATVTPMHGSCQTGGGGSGGYQELNMLSNGRARGDGMGEMSFDMAF